MMNNLGKALITFFCYYYEAKFLINLGKNWEK